MRKKIENSCLTCIKVNSKILCPHGTGVVVWKNCPRYKLDINILMEDDNKKSNPYKFLFKEDSRDI